MNDKAIEFETSIYKVKKALDRLKNIGLDVSKHEKLLEDVIVECNEKTSYNTNTVFKEAFIADAYIKAISKLDGIYYELNKYEIYLKVSSFNLVLKEYMISKEKKKEDLERFRNRLLQLLEKLKKSDTLDYQVEGPLVEDIYKLTYEFIKEEIKVLETSPTLHELQKDEIHTYNLDKQVVKELESLDLNDKKYSQIRLQKNKIDAEGINVNYLEESFIITIIRATTNKEELKEKIKMLSKKASQYYIKAKDIEKDIDKKENHIAELKEWSYIHKKKIYGNVALFTASIGTIVGLVIGSSKLAKIITIASCKKYNVEIESYSSLDGKLPVKEEIFNEEIDTVRLIEYEPFEKEDGYYVRNSTTYDLNNLEEMPLEEYLNINLEALGIKGESNRESKISLSISDLYAETYSIVEKLVTIEEITTYSKGKEMFFLMLLLIISFLIDDLIETAFLGNIVKKENKDGTKELEMIWGFVVALKVLIKNYEKLTEYKKDTNEKEIELNELYGRARNLFDENINLFNTIEKLLPYVENNTNLTEDIEELKEELSRTLKIEKKIFDKRNLLNKNE